MFTKPELQRGLVVRPEVPNLAAFPPSMFNTLTFQTASSVLRLQSQHVRNALTFDGNHRSFHPSAWAFALLTASSCLASVARHEPIHSRPRVALAHSPDIHTEFVPAHDCSAPVNTGLPSDGTKDLSSENELQAALDDTLSHAQKAFEAGRLEEALKKCQEALALDPKSAQAYYLVGAVELDLGAQEKAKQALLQSVKLDPSHIETHIGLGKIYLLSKDWRAAASEFQAGLKLGDSSGSGHFGLALTLLGKSQYSNALPHLRAAVAADRDDPERLFTLISTELKLNQVDDARKDLAQIEKLSSSDPWLFYRLGGVLREQGMLDAADASFERSAELIANAKSSPPEIRLSDLFLQIARLRFEQHDYPGALEYSSKINLESLDQNAQAEVLHLQGLALLGSWQLTSSADTLRQAAEKRPSAPNYFVHWVWAELMAGNEEAATSAAETGSHNWSQLPDVRQVVALLSRERMPERIRVPYSADWHLMGAGLVCCPCKVPCPCRSNASPTFGHCENTGVYHITRGHYGDVSLDGFTFVVIDASMGGESVPSSLYVNPSASNEQVIALERVFQTFSPLRPVIFLNVKRVPLSLVSEKEVTYAVKIPGVLELTIRRQLDSMGQPLMRTAALDFFSNTIEYAQNLIYKVWNGDGSLRWDFSGRQANFRKVDLDSDDYRRLKMLITYQDGSGYFNKKQLELINSMGLPTLHSYPNAKRKGNIR
jgi:tetratricopeptide (TPR) repeat protein